MTTIQDHDHALRYVARVGFAEQPGLPGWILSAQRRICDALDAIESGMDPLLAPTVPWPTRPEEHADRERYPYRAHYSRKARTFTVVTKQGKRYTVPAP